MRLMKILLSIAILCSSIGFVNTSISGQFKIKTSGQYKWLIREHEYKNNHWVLGDVAVEYEDVHEYKSNRLYVTDIRTGKRLWEKEFPLPDFTDVYRDNDKIFVFNKANFRDRTLMLNSRDSNELFPPTCYCVETRTGKLLWKQRCFSDQYSKAYTIDNCIVANNGLLKKDTGESKWTYSYLNHTMSNNFPSRSNYDIKNPYKRIIDGNKILIFGMALNSYGWYSHVSLHCLNASNGKLIWKHDNVGKIDDKYYANQKPTDGGMRYRGEYFTYLTDNNDYLLLAVVTGTEENIKNKIFCYNVDNGKLLWTKDLGGTRMDVSFKGTLSLGNGYALLCTEKILLLDIKTGKEIKIINTTSTIIQSESLDQIYIVNYKGVEAVKALTGKRLWYKKITLCSAENSQGYNYNGVILEKDNKLFILTDQGLTCIDATNGKTLDSWNYKVTPKSVFSAGKNLVACEIVNTEGSPTVLLFEY